MKPREILVILQRGTREFTATMTNVSVASSITVFHDGEGGADEILSIGCPEYLQRRERAERAAAKRSSTFAARRAHQELAQLLCAARQRIEAHGKVAE